MAEHFLSKSALRMEDCLTVAGGPVLESHAALREAIAARVGAEAADLLAEPFVSRDKAGTTLSVAWHSVHPGEDRALSDLEPTARRAVEDRLHRLIPRIEALAEDPELAGPIRAALSVSGPQDIRVINGAPVIVNWGVRSRLGPSPLAAFMRGDPAPVEPVTRAGALPPLPPGPSGGPPPVLPAATLSGSAAGLSASGTGLAASGTGLSASGAGAGGTRTVLPLAAWLPLPLLLVLAALTLAWLLWPGTRVFPPQAVVDETRVAGAQEAENAALRDRRDALRLAVQGATCRADGVLVLPGNQTPEGLVAPGLGEAPTTGPVAPDAALAPPAERAMLPGPPGAPGEASTLLASIEARTVLVVARSAGGVSTGSGFVVGPGLIVTNDHVVAGADAGGIFVINATLGRPEAAQVIKAVGPLETRGADFALLRIGPTTLPAFPLADPAASMKLHHVIAAGFPGDVMESDVAFQALLQGDASAIPDLVVVDGTVNAEQPLTRDTETLVHSAPLAQGNSGGPLVDFCGRVVGVNTFVRQGPLRTLNFALSAGALAQFLAGTPAAVTPDRATCQPVVAPAAEAQASPDAAEPAPPAPGNE